MHKGETHSCPTCGEAVCRDADSAFSKSRSVRGLSRRRLLGTGIALGIGANLPQRARAQATISADEALAQLMAGNQRFINKQMQSFDEDLTILKQNTAAKQEPFAAVLSCADSRVPVELVFDQSIGHVFVARVAGNLATNDIIASLEFGAAVLGAKAILVLGHSSCGAVKAAIAGTAVPGQISGLYPYMRAAVERGHADAEATTKANAQIQANLLATASPVIAELVSKGEVKVVAGYYDVASGQVSLLG